MSDRPHPLQSFQEIVHDDPDAAVEYIPDLIRHLRHGSPEERDAASQLLAEYAQLRAPELIYTLDRLVPLMRRHEGRVRTNVTAAFALVAAEEPSAIIELEQSKEVRVVDAFEQILNTGPEPARTNVGETLAYVASSSPKTVIEAMDSQGFAELFSGSAEQRRYALVTCSQVSAVAPETVQPYIRPIRTNVTPQYPTDEQLVALATLGRLADTSPNLVANRMEPLLNAARDHNPRVRSNALGVAALLARTHPEVAFDFCAIAADSLSREHVNERLNAVELLYRLAQHRPEHLREHGIPEKLQQRHEKDPNELVRSYAEIALLELKDDIYSQPSGFRSIAQNLFDRENLSTVMHNALGQTIINIEELVEDRHQNIEVRDGSRVEGDVGNAREDKRRADSRARSDSDRDRPDSR